MTYQINNPVGAMLAAVQFALHCEEQPEEREIWKKALLDVEAEAKRCGAIVRGIRLEANEDTAMIEIEDDGCGVPAERRHEVFDPFFTTRLEQGEPAWA